MSLATVTAREAAAVLSVHETPRRTPRGDLLRLQRALTQYPELAETQTAATRRLEERVACELVKDAAVLMPSGKLAQQIALRIHADRRPGRRTVVAHPANHLSLWEDSNLAVLLGLDVRPAGDRHELMSTAALAAAIDETCSSVLWELPQRELGGELPAWTDLQAQLAAATHLGAASHLDGARVWQAGPSYARPLAEICAGFDSVYVSLYKDLEAPRGAVLAGSDEFVRTARRWRQRLGGTIDEDWPLALLALAGLDNVGERMPSYVEHTRRVAAAIVARTPASVRPDPPQAAMCHVHLPVARGAAERAHARLLAEGAPRLALRFRSGPDPYRCAFELTVGESATTVSPQRAAAAVERLLRLASDDDVHVAFDNDNDNDNDNDTRHDHEEGPS